LSLFADRDKRLGIGGGNDDGIHFLGDHLFHQVNLTPHIQFVFDAIGEQFVLAAVGSLVRLRAVFHRQEELVGE